jgi:hypothetical protein
VTKASLLFACAGGVALASGASTAASLLFGLAAVLVTLSILASVNTWVEARERGRGRPAPSAGSKKARDVIDDLSAVAAGEDLRVPAGAQARQRLSTVLWLLASGDRELPGDLYGLTGSQVFTRACELPYFGAGEVLEAGTSHWVDGDDPGVRAVVARAVSEPLLDAADLLDGDHLLDLVQRRPFRNEWALDALMAAPSPSVALLGRLLEASAGTGLMSTAIKRFVKLDAPHQELFVTLVEDAQARGERFSVDSWSRFFIQVTATDD